MNGEDIRAYMKAAIDESSSPGSCASVEQLTAYLRNECDDGKREWIQDHLVSCDECRSVLLDLSGFVTAAVQAPQGAAEPGVEQKWQELQRRLRSDQKPAPWWKSWLSGFRPAIVFSAACLTLAATAVTRVILLQGKLATVEVAYRNLSNEYSQKDTARQRVEAEIAELRAPQLNLPVFDVLPSGSANRSAGDQQLNTFTLPATGRFVLVLSGAARHTSFEYSISISDERAAIVYSGKGLEPDSQGNLLMTIDRSFLPAGRYRVNVGERTGSGFRTVANYLIRLTDQRESPKSENPAQ